MPNIFKVPKKAPEEKVPVPAQKKEAPPAKGTSFLFNLNFLIISFHEEFYVLCQRVLMVFDVFCL